MHDAVMKATERHGMGGHLGSREAWDGMTLGEVTEPIRIRIRVRVRARVRVGVYEPMTLSRSEIRQGHETCHVVCCMACVRV